MPTPLFERGCAARPIADFRGPSSPARTKFIGCTQHTKRPPQWYQQAVQLPPFPCNIYTRVADIDSTDCSPYLSRRHARGRHKTGRRTSLGICPTDASLFVVRESESRESRATPAVRFQSLSGSVAATISTNITTQSHTTLSVHSPIIILSRLCFPR